MHAYQKDPDEQERKRVSRQLKLQHWKGTYSRSDHYTEGDGDSGHCYLTVMQNFTGARNVLLKAINITTHKQHLKSDQGGGMI